MKIAFLFDMDGVIAHTNPYHKVAIFQFCESKGKPINEEILAEHVYGRSNKQWIPELFGAMSAEQLHEYSEEKESLFRSLYHRYLAPVFGLLEFLEAAKKENIPMAVATSAPKSNADYILDGLNIRHYFDGLVCGSDVNEGKPNPEIYLRAAEQLQTHPENCIVFEDSISGIRAGYNASAKVVAIGTTHTAEELPETGAYFPNFLGVDLHMLKKL